MSEILSVVFTWALRLLAVGAVVLIASIALGSNKTQNTISDISQLVTNSQALYGSTPAFTSLTNTVAINGALAPSDMISGTALVNPWNGTVTVNVNAGSSQLFDITETAVPSDSCAHIIGAFTNIQALKINGTAKTLPMDPGAATAACATAPNTMILTFGH